MNIFIYNKNAYLKKNVGIQLKILPNMQYSPIQPNNCYIHSSNQEIVTVPILT